MVKMATEVDQKNEPTTKDEPDIKNEPTTKDQPDTKNEPDITNEPSNEKEEQVKQTNQNKEEITDEYHYTQSGEYTCEMFKVVVQNLPSKVSYGHFRIKLKEILGFQPKKLKYNPKNNYAFCAFKDEEQRMEAMEKLNGYEWKSSHFYCKKAGPAKDPFIRENKRRATDADYKSKKQKLDDLEGTTPEEKIVHVVCPYAKYTYEQQVKMKGDDMKSYIKKLTEDMRRSGIRGWLNTPENNMCLDLLPVVTSPIEKNYRNKVEFTIGVGSDGKDNTVGFRLGSYRDGNLSIVNATNCPNCTKVSVDLAKEMETFFQTKTNFPSYNLINHVGFYQQLTVRTCTTGDVMAMLQTNTSFITEEQREEWKTSLKEYLSSEDRIVKVTSFYLSSSTQKNNNIDIFEHLFGSEHIHEKMHGLTFRISPDAFFQVNTPAAELLYGIVKEWCDKDQENSCVLDVCCGTGTIGLFIAKDTDIPVVGVEISEQAVHDAKHNATLNGIENSKFVCGAAEKVLHNEIKSLNKKNVIAVVDPPRAGLHKDVLHLLRSCNAIQKIIYVSCSPKQAADNFIGFCRPESKKYRGRPFRTVRAVPVDLFPQTAHCELIVQLERVPKAT